METYRQIPVYYVRTIISLFKLLGFPQGGDALYEIASKPNRDIYALLKQLEVLVRWNIVPRERLLPTHINIGTPLLDVGGNIDISPDRIENIPHDTYLEADAAYNRKQRRIYPLLRTTLMISHAIAPFISDERISMSLDINKLTKAAFGQDSTRFEIRIGEFRNNKKTFEETQKLLKKVQILGVMIKASSMLWLKEYTPKEYSKILKEQKVSEEEILSVDRIRQRFERRVYKILTEEGLSDFVLSNRFSERYSILIKHKRDTLQKRFDLLIDDTLRSIQLTINLFDSSDMLDSLNELCESKENQAKREQIVEKDIEENGKSVISSFLSFMKDTDIEDLRLKLEYIKSQLNEDPILSMLDSGVTNCIHILQELGKLRREDLEFLFTIIETDTIKKYYSIDPFSFHRNLEVGVQSRLSLSLL